MKRLALIVSVGMGALCAPLETWSAEIWVDGQSKAAAADGTPAARLEGRYAVPFELSGVSGTVRVMAASPGAVKRELHRWVWICEFEMQTSRMSSVVP